MHDHCARDFKVGRYAGVFSRHVPSLFLAPL